MVSLSGDSSAADSVAADGSGVAEAAAARKRRRRGGSFCSGASHGKPGDAGVLMQDP